MDQLVVERVLRTGVRARRQLPQVYLLPWSSSVDGWAYYDEVNVIIKLVTACGCERIRNESWGRPRPEVELNLYQPLYGGCTELNGNETIKLFRRLFKFYDTEVSDRTYMYVYREVL